MIVLPARPCYYDGGVVCDDCDGRPATCRRLISEDDVGDESP